MKQNNMNLKKLAGKIILVIAISGSVIYGVSPAQASNLTVGDIFSGIGFFLNVAESNRDVPLPPPPPAHHHKHYRPAPLVVHKVPANPKPPVARINPQPPAAFKKPLTKPRG